MDSSDLNTTGQTRTTTPECAGHDHQGVDGQTDQLRRFGVAPHHSGGETMGAERKPQIGQDTQHQAPQEAPVHVIAPHATDEQRVGQRLGRGFVQTGGVSHQVLHHKLEQIDGDIAHQ